MESFRCLKTVQIVPTGSPGWQTNDSSICCCPAASRYSAQYGADVTALRWIGTGFLEESYYIIYYSGHPANHVLGVLEGTWREGRRAKISGLLGVGLLVSQ